MLRALKFKWKCSESAALLEKLAEEMQREGTYQFATPPKDFGFGVISTAVRRSPALFDGRNGHIPHRFAFAAYALGMFTEKAKKDGDLPEWALGMTALAKLLQGIAMGGFTIPFTPQDLQMIELSKKMHDESVSVLLEGGLSDQ